MLKRSDVVKINELVSFLKKHQKNGDKEKIKNLLQKQFDLTQDRSVFYCESFAVRISSSSDNSFSNTVLSLSALQKHDHRPFIVVLVLPSEIKLLLANSTLLKKISHSSQELSEKNIKGSFNGSDILRDLSGIPNNSSNLVKLYRIHEGIGFEGNLKRLVEETLNINPSGSTYEISQDAKAIIEKAPKRAAKFCKSSDYLTLKTELDAKVDKYREYIIVASLIDNVNVRGRVIEYLITGDDQQLIDAIISRLEKNSSSLPEVKTENTLGDFEKIFDEFDTATDVKTKIMLFESNPKAYNIDKMLTFLSNNRSVFMFYFVGIDTSNRENPTQTVLISMFQNDLRESTLVLKHWAGRNSRGVTQFNGETIHELILKPNNEIDVQASQDYLSKLMSLSS